VVSAYWITPVSRSINRVGSILVYPFLKIYKSASSCVDATFFWVLSKRKLQERVNDLEEERKKFIEEMTELKASINYSADIKELRSYKYRYKRLAKSHIVQVLMINCTPYEHYILIEGGTNQNFSEGMLAIVNNHLVGRVVEAFSYYSKVLLLTDKRINVAAYCAKMHTRGIVNGTNSGHMKLKFVDHMKRLRKDDMVLSSGHGLLYPKGLCLGKIVDFVKNDVEYDVNIAPLIDLQKISYCFVIHPSQMR